MIKINKCFQALGESFFSYVKPTELANSQVVHFNRNLQQKLGLSELDDNNINKLLAGSVTIPGYEPFASVYAGHQFGVPVPQLGDGRAIMIAEHQDENNSVWELQLKGAGKTPYSRMGDGRAVLRSTIREYLCSHAMHFLGIPTTQALAMMVSDSPVYREQVEKAAVALRVAPTFVRFGHFEYFAKRKKISELTQLTKFVISNYFPGVDIDSEDYVPVFLRQVVKSTAEMIAHWQSVGFVHGVMNSDNMSILGLTLDYGPFSFLDSFNPEQIFNHSDSEGRYVYAKQPYIAWWNLYRLAEALVVIYLDADRLETELATYSEVYNNKYQELMAAKMGLISYTEDDIKLLDELLIIMQKQSIDWTFFWRRLSYSNEGIQEINKFYFSDELNAWVDKLKVRQQVQSIAVDEIKQLMLKSNPAIVLRNHLVQYAIQKAEQGNFEEISRLFNALAKPYNELPEYSDYYKIAPDWSQHIVLSCSS